MAVGRVRNEAVTLSVYVYLPIMTILVLLLHFSEHVPLHKFSSSKLYESLRRWQ